MSQTSTLGRTATTVQRDKITGALSVRYHWTDVVKSDASGTVTLNSGGWRTATTKLRMNQAANQFGLGFRVSQRKGSWFVLYGKRNREVPFQDGMSFKP